MSFSLRHISASLFLALYLPIALALPFFHSHIAVAAFGGVASYAEHHASDAEHGHQDDCPACKFASSHWMEQAVAGTAPAEATLSFAVPYYYFSSLSPLTPSSRAPPTLS